jgi:tetratricopeptide (TPR) repeat protein
VKQKRFGDALVHLKKAEAADPTNYLVHYYHAFALSRAVMDERLTVTNYESQSVDIMRDELRRAIELNPAFSDSYTLLAFINLTREEQLDESIELVRHALSLSPGRDDYVFVLAQIYVRKQDFETARQVLQPMLRDNADETIRQSATTLVSSIKKIEEQLERLKAANKLAEENGVPSAQGNDALKEPSLESFLRKPQKGERRVRGYLNRVECAPGTVLFFVDAGGESLTFHATRLERVRFVTFTSDIGREMVCGQRRPPNSVVVTYRPLKEFNGEIISVEFVPSDFELQSP